MANTTLVSLANIALRGVTMFGRFVLLLVLANYLAPAEVGLFALITAAVLWGVYLQGLEFYLFSLRELVAADPATWALRIRDSFTLYGVVFGGAVVVWVGLFAAGLLPWQVFGWFVAILALEHVAQELYRLLNVFGRPLAGSLVLFARSGSWMYVGAGMMALDPTQRSLSLVLHAWVIGAGASVALAWVFLRDLPWRGLPRVDRAWLRRGLSVALPLLAGSLAFRGIALFDRWYLGYASGDTELGVYGFFATIAGSLPVLVESGVGAVLYPKMMKAWQVGDHVAYRAHLRQLIKAFGGFLSIAIPLVAIAMVLVVGRLSERIYATQMSVFAVLLASAGVWAAGAVPQYALWAKQRDRTIIMVSVLGLVVAVALDLVLVPRYGALGAAWGQLGAMTAMLVARVIALRGT